MFEKIRIDSRTGNRLIAAAGIVYAITALLLLAYHLVTVWGAESLVDRALQLALVLTFAGGLSFVALARTNLRRVR